MDSAFFQGKVNALEHFAAAEGLADSRHLYN